MKLIHNNMINKCGDQAAASALIMRRELGQIDTCMQDQRSLRGLNSQIKDINVDLECSFFYLLNVMMDAQYVIRKLLCCISCQKVLTTHVSLYVCCMIPYNFKAFQSHQGMLLSKCEHNNNIGMMWHSSTYLIKSRKNAFPLNQSMGTKLGYAYICTCHRHYCAMPWMCVNHTRINLYRD